MSYLPTGDEVAVQVEKDKTLELLEEVIRRQKKEEESRQLTLAIGALGALFAAVRLGIVFAPKVKRRRQLGKLGE